MRVTYTYVDAGRPMGPFTGEIKKTNGTPQRDTYLSDFGILRERGSTWIPRQDAPDVGKHDVLSYDWQHVQHFYRVWRVTPDKVRVVMMRDFTLTKIHWDD